MSPCTHRFCWTKAAITLQEHYCQENFPKGTLQALHSQLVHPLALAYPYLKLGTMNLWKHICFSCCLALFFPLAIPEEENSIHHHHCCSGEGWTMAIAQRSITEAQNTPPKPCKQRQPIQPDSVSTAVLTTPWSLRAPSCPTADDEPLAHFSLQPPINLKPLSKAIIWVKIWIWVIMVNSK